MSGGLRGNWNIPVKFNYVHPLRRPMSKFELLLYNEDVTTLMHSEVVTQGASHGTEVGYNFVVPSANYTPEAWHSLEVRVWDADDRRTMFSQHVSIFAGQYGHEDLHGLLPDGNPRGEHYHLNFDQYSMIDQVTKKGPLKPKVLTPGADGGNVTYTAAFHVAYTYEHPLNKPMSGLKLQVADNPDMSTPFFDRTVEGWPNTDIYQTFSPSGLMFIKGSEYWVRVMVSDNAGIWSEWSDARQFYFFKDDTSGGNSGESPLQIEVPTLAWPASWSVYDDAFNLNSGVPMTVVDKQGSFFKFGGEHPRMVDRTTPEDNGLTWTRQFVIELDQGRRSEYGVDELVYNAGPFSPYFLRTDNAESIIITVGDVDIAAHLLNNNGLVESWWPQGRHGRVAFFLQDFCSNGTSARSASAIWENDYMRPRPAINYPPYKPIEPGQRH